MSTNIDLCAALQEKLGNHEMKECAALVHPHAFLSSVSFKSSYFNFPLFSLVIVRNLYPSHILQVIVKFTLHSNPTAISPLAYQNESLLVITQYPL